MSNTRPTAFVSWAHSAADWDPSRRASWQREILEFTNLLRANGIDADVDLYHLHDQAPDWTRFGPNKVRESDFVLVAVSQSWTRRFDGTEAPTLGAGAARESDALLSIFTRDRAEFSRKLKLVFLPGSDTAAVPETLDGVQHFVISQLTRSGLEDLLRTLHGQPLYPRPPMGSAPLLPPAMKTAIAPTEELGDEPQDPRSIRYTSTFVDPPGGQVPGWNTEPLLRLRVASYITPVTAAETTPLKPAVRDAAVTVLNDLQLNTSLRSLARQLTPKSALLDDAPAGPPADLAGWRVNPDGHLTSDHAMMQIGGNGSSGAVANLTISLPAVTHGADAILRLDVGLSFEERIALATLARLTKDCMEALPSLRGALNDILPSRASLGLTGFTISAPRNVAATYRDNSLEQHVDWAAIGPLTRAIQGDIGVSFVLPGWYESVHAAEVTYWGFDRITTDVGALDPDGGLAEIGVRLGLELA